MKNFLQSIFTVVVGLYMAVAVMIFAPYYNWNYAKKHGFLKWLCFGEVVATAQAAVWPYYVFSATPTDCYDSPDADHIRNSKQAFDEALNIVDRAASVTKLTSDQKVKFADLLRLAIAEANQVQRSWLQEAHVDYVNMFENKYIHGMSLMLQGTETDNAALVLSGAFECNEFSDWINSTF